MNKADTSRPTHSRIRLRQTLVNGHQNADVTDGHVSDIPAAISLLSVSSLGFVLQGVRTSGISPWTSRNLYNETDVFYRLGSLFWVIGWMVPSPRGMMGEVCPWTRCLRSALALSCSRSNVDAVVSSCVPSRSPVYSHVYGRKDCGGVTSPSQRGGTPHLTSGPDIDAASR